MERSNIIILIISLLFSLVILEIGLRTFTPYPISRVSNRIEHEQLGHVMDPGMAEIDEHGFRNNNSGPVDIVALGDSHTYGYNVSSESSWPKLLGRKLEKNVYNFGIGGYGILQYKILLGRSIALNPEVVLLALYLPNDLNDVCKLISSSTYWTSKAEALHMSSDVCPEKETYVPFGVDTEEARTIYIGKWLKENSALISIMSKYYYRLSSRKKINVQEQKAVNKREKNGAADALVINDGKIKTMIDFRRIKLNKECMDMSNPAIQMGYEVLKEFLLEAKKNTDLNKIHFGILFIPSKERVLYEYLKQAGHHIPEEYDDLVENEDELKGMTSVFLENIGIQFIDVLPGMENALLKHGDIYPAWDDGHTISIGYEVFAESAFNLYQQIISSTDGNEN